MHKGTDTALTVPRVRGLKPNEIAWDSLVRGFYARRRTGPAITFWLRVRVNGKQRKIAIGRYGVLWTVETARKEAAQLAAQAAKGIDPKPARMKAEDEPVDFNAAVKAFLEDYGAHLKESTRALYMGLLKCHVQPKLGNRTLRSIATVDIQTLHEKMGQQRRSANHVLAVTSSLMVWCETKGWRDKGTNPCKGIRRFKENKRNRYLSREEAENLGAVLRRAAEEQTQNLYVLAAIWVIIFTGARRNEVLKLKWEYIDWERGTANLPDSKTGPKSLVLSSYALDVLRRVPKIEGNPFVFVGVKEGKSLVNIRKPWLVIAAAAGIEGVRIHDLRHSFGNKAIDVGGSVRVLGKALGHAEGKTTERYAHASDRRVAELVELTGREIAGVMRPSVAVPVARKVRYRPLRPLLENLPAKRTGGSVGEGQAA
jgi:integrase